ncbi:hypothetical protein EGW08_000909, partial [Elysia chlorotica]
MTFVIVEHYDSARLGLWVLSVNKRCAHDVIWSGVFAQRRGDQAQSILIGQECVGVEHWGGDGRKREDLLLLAPSLIPCAVCPGAGPPCGASRAPQPRQLRGRLRRVQGRQAGRGKNCLHPRQIALPVVQPAADDAKRLRRFLICDAPFKGYEITKKFSCKLKMLSFIMMALSVPVWISVRVEWAHVVHFLEVDIGEHQLVVAAVDHSRPVRAGKHVCRGHRAERFQDGRLCAQSHLLLFRQM